MSWCFPKSLSIPARFAALPTPQLSALTISGNTSPKAYWSRQRHSEMPLPARRSDFIWMSFSMALFRSLDIDAKAKLRIFLRTRPCRFHLEDPHWQPCVGLSYNGPNVRFAPAPVPPRCDEPCFSARAFQLVSATVFSLVTGDHWVRPCVVAGPIIGKGRQGHNRRAKSTGMECEGEGVESDTNTAFSSASASGPGYAAHLA